MNSSGDGTCKCTIKFYDDGTSQDCKPCHFSCETCIVNNAIDKCESCSSSNFRIAEVVGNSFPQKCICMVIILNFRFFYLFLIIHKVNYWDNGAHLCECNFCLIIFL